MQEFLEIAKIYGLSAATSLVLGWLLFRHMEKVNELDRGERKESEAARDKERAEFVERLEKMRCAHEAQIEKITDGLANAIRMAGDQQHRDSQELRGALKELSENVRMNTISVRGK